MGYCIGLHPGLFFNRNIQIMETLLWNLYEDGEMAGQEKWVWNESCNIYRIFIRYNTGFGNRDFQETNVPSLIYKREPIEE